MIDCVSDKLITLAEAAEMIPGRKPGKHASIPTLYRMASAGVRGVVLETVVAGGTICTTRQSVANFIERVTAARRSGRPDPTGNDPAERTGAQRQRDSEAAARKFDRMSQTRSGRSGRTTTVAAG